MGFTGLYKEYYYYSWFIFVLRFRSGSYDYRRNGEERCGWAEKSDLIDVRLTPSKAKQVAEELNMIRKTIL
jgi:hypothetical protein